MKKNTEMIAWASFNFVCNSQHFCFLHSWYRYCLYISPSYFCSFYFRFRSYKLDVLISNFNNVFSLFFQKSLVIQQKTNFGKFLFKFHFAKNKLFNEQTTPSLRIYRFNKNKLKCVMEYCILLQHATVYFRDI